MGKEKILIIDDEPDIVDDGHVSVEQCAVESGGAENAGARQEIESGQTV